uniref:Uncharacterized protein n=1 Tax=Anguilla anguilla TaxID=7936 RepID=A0A0E9PUG9_ANGAN
MTQIAFLCSDFGTNWNNALKNEAN